MSILRLCLLAAIASSVAAVPSGVTVKTSRGSCDLHVYPPAEVKADSKPIILLVSGEGGWRRFDILLAGALAGDGYWVGGIDAKQYFWNAQDDRQALADDFRLYAKALADVAGRPAGAPLILAGFSFGADLAPWIAGAGGWNGRIGGMVMLGPDETGSLEFRFSELLGFDPKDHTFPVADALRSASGIPALFIHGGKDAGSAAPALLARTAEPKKLIVVPGADHHFSGREEGLRAALHEGMEWILLSGRTAP
ncbi:MAG TPA: AcvB/VirJ family lysyl-phosphatidylglycerol hydrolase [Candidatus Polarisedimenticolia bacterium]|nr:AcvB/VirJ family lysyl-phosphatidylglycerol hydrolase [Candidatus Polarisedimenticolia bacterium]